MSQPQNQEYAPATFVNVKRVKTETDAKGRDRTVLTLGPDNKGTDGVKALADALNAYVAEGKQVNLDIRTEMKEAQNGSKFPSAFIRVTEMVPRGAGAGAPGATTTRFVPKAKTDVKAQSAAIRSKFNE